MQNHLEDAERYKFKISSLEKEIRRISLLLSDERSSMSNEMNTVMSENEAERKRLTNELRHKAEEAEIRKQEIGKVKVSFTFRLQIIRYFMDGFLGFVFSLKHNFLLFRRKRLH